jgi:hypothetical protein
MTTTADLIELQAEVYCCEQAKAFAQQKLDKAKNALNKAKNALDVTVISEARARVPYNWDIYA